MAFTFAFCLLQEDGDWIIKTLGYCSLKRTAHVGVDFIQNSSARTAATSFARSKAYPVSTVPSPTCGVAVNGLGEVRHGKVYITRLEVSTFHRLGIQLLAYLYNCTCVGIRPGRVEPASSIELTTSRRSCASSLSPSPFSIMRGRRLAARRGVSGRPWSWLPTSSVRLRHVFK